MPAVRQAGPERSDPLPALWPRLPRSAAAPPDRSTRTRPIEKRAGGKCDGDSLGRSRRLPPPARPSTGHLPARSDPAGSFEPHRLASSRYIGVCVRQRCRAPGHHAAGPAAIPGRPASVRRHLGERPRRPLSIVSPGRHAQSGRRGAGGFPGTWLVPRFRGRTDPGVRPPFDARRLATTMSGEDRELETRAPRLAGNSSMRPASGIPWS